MTTEKRKRITVAVTVTAVILIAFLVIFWIYQMIALSVSKRRIDDLERRIEHYREQIEDAKDAVDSFTSEGYFEFVIRENDLVKPQK